jgi:hypothetical protein
MQAQKMVNVFPMSTRFHNIYTNPSMFVVTSVTPQYPHGQACVRLDILVHVYSSCIHMISFIFG